MSIKNSEPYGVLGGSELLYDLGIVFCAHVGDDVAYRVVGLQVLTEDVYFAFRQNTVDSRQDARHVAVDVDEAVRVLELGQLYAGEIHAQERVAGIDEARELRRNELADVLLRLLGGAADVRR